MQKKSAATNRRSVAPEKKFIVYTEKNVEDVESLIIRSFDRSKLSSDTPEGHTHILNDLSKKIQDFRGEILDLSRVNLVDRDTRTQIIAGIRNHESIESINLSGSLFDKNRAQGKHFYQREIIQFVKELKSVKSLKYLDLSKNELGSTAKTWISNIAEQQMHSCTIALNNNNIIWNHIKDTNQFTRKLPPMILDDNPASKKELKEAEKHWQNTQHGEIRINNAIIPSNIKISETAHKPTSPNKAVRVLDINRSPVKKTPKNKEEQGQGSDESNLLEDSVVEKITVVGTTADSQDLEVISSPTEYRVHLDLSTIESTTDIETIHLVMEYLKEHNNDKPKNVIFSKTNSEDSAAQRFNTQKDAIEHLVKLRNDITQDTSVLVSSEYGTPTKRIPGGNTNADSAIKFSPTQFIQGHTPVGSSEVVHLNTPTSPGAAFDSDSMSPVPPPNFNSPTTNVEQTTPSTVSRLDFDSPTNVEQMTPSPVPPHKLYSPTEVDGTTPSPVPPPNFGSTSTHSIERTAEFVSVSLGYNDHANNVPARVALKLVACVSDSVYKTTISLHHIPPRPLDPNSGAMILHPTAALDSNSGAKILHSTADKQLMITWHDTPVDNKAYDINKFLYKTSVVVTIADAVIDGLRCVNTFTVKSGREFFKSGALASNLLFGFGGISVAVSAASAVDSYFDAGRRGDNGMKEAGQSIAVSSLFMAAPYMLSIAKMRADSGDHSHISQGISVVTGGFILGSIAVSAYSVIKDGYKFATEELFAEDTNSLYASSFVKSTYQDATEGWYTEGTYSKSAIDSVNSGFTFISSLFSSADSADSEINEILQNAESKIKSASTLYEKHKLFLEYSSILESNIASSKKQTIEALREDFELSQRRDSLMKKLYENIKGSLLVEGEATQGDTSSEYPEFLCGCSINEVEISGRDKLMCDLICDQPET